MRMILRASVVEMKADADPSVRWKSRWLEVIDPDAPLVDGQKLGERCLPAYWLMCDAIQTDIESAEGSGADFISGIRRIEFGETDKIEADGTAWVAHIARDKVWFEGLYNQGEGGEVSFAQYKLAVETYVRFLSDPERKPIEVEFPAA